ncbi:MAG: amidase [Planctomycetaceae bacterium]|nr:amidase [Planctomycetaceae bacterium]
MPIDTVHAFATIRELGRRLRARQFTSVDLTRLFLDRLEKHGKALNAVVTITGEIALRQAQQADDDLAAGRDRGPLHGIPYGAKDLLATVGAPTTWGAPPLADQRFDEDATVVARLREAGAVLVAKLAMVELAGGLGYEQADAALTGPGLNPWNPKHWAGGSSSGSGAAVGAGLVPFAIGSETSGSIVTPAAYCGVSGLRPTYGRVSRHGAMALTWSFDRLGPMARSADCCGLVLAAIAGYDPLDLSTSERDYKYDAKSDSERFKLAVVANSADGIQPEVAENFAKSLEFLRERAEITEVQTPDLPYGAVVGTIIDCEAAAVFEPLLDDGRVWKMRAPEDRIGLHVEQFISAKDYINAQRIRRVIAREMDKLLAPFDAIVMPGRSSVAPPIDRTFGEYSRAWKHPTMGTAENAAGVPSLTLPNGFGPHKLPTSIHFATRAFDENRLLRLGRYLQNKTDWHQRRPPLG